MDKTDIYSKKLILLTPILLFTLYNSPVLAKDTDTKAFPDDVYIKTRTETFHSRAYFIIRNGKIWTKKNYQTTKTKDKWHLMPFNGLPFSDKEKDFPKAEKIVEIYADADELLAIDNKGRFFVKQSKGKGLYSDDLWHYNIGFPKQPLKYNKLTNPNRSLSMGRRHFDVLWYEDPFGNKHHYGTMGTSTIYLLSEDGKEIMYTDNGLPADFSHRICGPDRGKFTAENLQSSGGTLFLADTSGNLYTRMDDFDLNGGTSMFFKYTYKPYKSDLSGEDYRSSLSPIGLSLKDWQKQPTINLKNKAKITKKITILQNGYGNAARELRVAGLNDNGESGYYYKNIFADKWLFKKTNLTLNKEDFFTGSNQTKNMQSQDLKYNGFINFPNGSRYKAELSDFNLQCSPANLVIHFGDYKAKIRLHTVEAWIYTKRLDPGRDGTPKVFLGTIEIDKNNLPLVPEELRNLNMETFAFSVSADLKNVYLTADKNWQKISMDFGREGKLPSYMKPEFKAGIVTEDNRYIFVDDLKKMIHDMTLPNNTNINNLSELKSKVDKIKYTKTVSEKFLKDRENMMSQQQKIIIFYGLIEKTMGIIQVDKVLPVSDKGTALIKAYYEAEKLNFDTFKDTLKEKITLMDNFININDKKLIELEKKALQTNKDYSGKFTYNKSQKPITMNIKYFNLNKKVLNITDNNHLSFKLSLPKPFISKTKTFPFETYGILNTIKDTLPKKLFILRMPVKVTVERDNIQIVPSSDKIKDFNFLLYRKDSK